MGLERK